MSNAVVPEDLQDHPPSSILVYRLLAEQGPMTVTDLCAAAYLADKTARRALQRLEDDGLVTTQPGPDARATLYAIDG